MGVARENKSGSILEISDLISKISAAVRLGETSKITNKIKCDLEDLIKNGHLALPDEVKVPQADCYARRLLHRDEKLGFTMVAMTWGPGQGTPIHDHSGIWCVEGVIEGRMSVTSYHVKEKAGELYKFEEVDRVTAGVGGAGALIPPYEHHLLKNVLNDKTSVTLHIYGGEINQCSAFVQDKNDWYRREMKNLSYT